MKKTSISLKMFLVILIMVFFFSVVISTYAYFYFLQSNETSISGNAAMINLTLRVNRVLPVSDSNNTGVMVPQKQSALSSALTSSCIDDNNNIVCHVYSVYIKNNSTANVVVNGNIYFFGDASLVNNISSSMPNLKWRLVDFVDENNISNSVLGNNESNIASSSEGLFAKELSLNSNQERTYYLIVWVNEVNTNQSDADKSFFGRVEFLSSNGSGVTATFENISSEGI